MKPILSAVSVCAGLVLTATTAHAVTMYTFATSQGAQPANVGVVSIAKVDDNTVRVKLDLVNTDKNVSPYYGILNTGNHLPFAFNIDGSEALSASFIQPAGGSYAFGLFALDTAGGTQPAFGTWGVAITNTAGNGSVNAYYGDLEFDLTRASGLTVDSFIANAAGWYFTADLTDGTSTGAQAWKTRLIPDPPPRLPEPGSLALLGLGLAGLGLLRRRK